MFTLTAWTYVPRGAKESASYWQELQYVCYYEKWVGGNGSNDAGLYWRSSKLPHAFNGLNDIVISMRSASNGVMKVLFRKALVNAAPIPSFGLEISLNNAMYTRSGHTM